MDVKKELNKLTKKELIDLIDSYDTYIINFCDNNEGARLNYDCTPCCLMEFYDNEYQDILENRYY